MHDQNKYYRSPENAIYFVQAVILMFRFWNTAGIEENGSFFILKNADDFMDSLFKGWTVAFAPTVLFV